MKGVVTKKILRVAAAATLTLTVVASSLPFLASSEASAIQPGYNGKIALDTDRDGGYALYTMDGDGSNQTKLIDGVGSARYPQWSPDGSKIVFYTYRFSTFDIYAIDADGSNLTRLTNAPEYDGMSVWSPDGTKIMFVSNRDGNYEIYTMDADGSNQANLTNSPGSDTTPQWSPDGTKIMFESNRDGNYEIYTMDADGSNQANITNIAGSDSEPGWSPDGTKIVFTSNRSGNNEIFVMDADGSNMRNITNSVGSDRLPQLSPDGTKVAFLSNRSGDYKLYVVNIDGGNTLLMPLDTFDVRETGFYRPVFSPDGKKILAHGYHGDDWEADLFSINVDGSGIEKLTTDGDTGWWGNGDWMSTPNTPPVTVNDSASVLFNTPTLVDVLGNDTDEEALSGGNLSIVGQPTHGSASVVGGKVRYAPTLGYQGSDTLVYEICDSFMLDQQCATGTVNLTVLAPTAPVLVVTNVNGEQYTSSTTQYVTASLRPTFSGTATPGSSITVTIHSDPIVLTTTADGDGNWSVTPTFDLPAGEHMVYVTATLAGFTTELDSFALSIGSLASTGANLWIIVNTGMAALGGGTILIFRRQTDKTSRMHR